MGRSITLQGREECFEQIRTILGYLPNCGQVEAPPVVDCDDPEDLDPRSVMPI